MTEFEYKQVPVWEACRSWHEDKALIVTRDWECGEGWVAHISPAFQSTHLEYAIATPKEKPWYDEVDWDYFGKNGGLRIKNEYDEFFHTYSKAIVGLKDSVSESFVWYYWPGGGKRPLPENVKVEWRFRAGEASYENTTNKAPWYSAMFFRILGLQSE